MNEIFIEIFEIVHSIGNRYISVLSFCGGRGEKLEKLKLAKVYDEYDDNFMNDKDVICRGKKTKHRLEFAPKREQTAKEQNECPLTK